MQRQVKFKCSDCPKTLSFSDVPSIRPVCCGKQMTMLVEQTHEYEQKVSFNSLEFNVFDALKKRVRLEFKRLYEITKKDGFLSQIEQIKDLSDPKAIKYKKSVFSVFGRPWKNVEGLFSDKALHGDKGRQFNLDSKLCSVCPKYASFTCKKHGQHFCKKHSERHLRKNKSDSFETILDDSL